jgi:hypothetical protein
LKSFTSDSRGSKHGGSKRSYIPKGFLEKYLKELDENPLRTRSLTFAVVGAVGSMLGARKNPSKESRKRPTIDWPEVLSFTLHGGLVAGPLSHYW